MRRAAGWVGALAAVVRDPGDPTQEGFEVIPQRWDDAEPASAGGCADAASPATTKPARTAPSRGDEERREEVADFYDGLADDYHLIYSDWDASMRRQGDALGALIGQDPAAVLDCSCGIGTQAIGLALRGHRVVGTDLSRRAAARATREAARRNLGLRTAAADMRRLPFPDGRFGTVVCADNSLPHLLTEQDVLAALAEMRRVLRPAGLLLVSTRPYDDLLRDRPASTPPQIHRAADGADCADDGDRTVTFQLWHWHDDGEHYDLEHFQLRPAGGEWRVQVRRTTYWALGQDRLAGLAAEAGFVDLRWRTPQETGFFQPLLVARAGSR